MKTQTNYLKNLLLGAIILVLPLTAMGNGSNTAFEGGPEKDTTTTDDEAPAYIKSTKRTFTLTVKDDKQKVNYCIKNRFGDIIKEDKNCLITDGKISIDVSALKKGTYYLEVETKRKKSVMQFIN